MLLPVSKPLLFVDTLIRITRNCSLTGQDFRFILQQAMGERYDEAELIETVEVLNPDHDIPHREGEDEEGSGEESDTEPCKEEEASSSGKCKTKKRYVRKPKSERVYYLWRETVYSHP